MKLPTLIGREIVNLGLIINSIAEHKKRIGLLHQMFIDACYREDKAAAKNIHDEINYVKGLICGYENCKNLIIERANQQNQEIEEAN